ncbi:MAG: glutathione peroxidase [Cytophagales bacterium]|nr:MAG: glutathione peroxidase [Cytophagales bacterium]TAF61393.1 MAG: glutathione peroxidase [Cytophagales bacterium]
MKHYFFLGLVLAVSLSLACRSNGTVNPQNKQNMSSVHDFSLPSLEGKDIKLSSFKGKKLLIVNTASACGYTPQYADLEKVHDTYGSQIAVLGFPANNFGGQEPGSNSEIGQFCQKNYGVSFQMFGKIDVVGEKCHPLYSFLAEKAGSKPNWNFCKYVVDENGKVLKFYPSSAKPLDIAKEIIGG